jgi:nicotinate phosphoribosyltransferase
MRSSGLATDLYQLTMAAAYWANGMGDRTATFELFVRSLPRDRGYLVVAGLEQAVEFLQSFSYNEAAIQYLRALPQFAHIEDGFFAALRRLRFTGDLWAMPEGTVAFANEPLLRVTAPLMQAQIVETFLLASVNFQTLIASKASRVVEAAAGRSVVEFGARRAHGFEAAVLGARAAYLAGCVGTSNVLAGQQYKIPVYGTAAHSFTMAFPREIEAFQAFHRLFPEHTTLLIDTYDTLEGARSAAKIGPGVGAVRLDSGDLLSLSRQVREILDAAGLVQTRIFASGDLNEWRIGDLLAAGAPIDLFGVGTDMAVSRDAPALGGVYKLVAQEVEGVRRPAMKLSTDKATYPEAKQVYRRRGDDGRIAGDLLALHDERFEPPADGAAAPVEPLLEPVLAAGQLVRSLPSLEASRRRAREQVAALPDIARRLDDPKPVPVEISPGLRSLTDHLAALLG